jgi:hypothetical protein
MINLPQALTYLLVAFIVMKVAGIIDWSWWLVVSPLYVPLAFMVGLAMFVFIGWAERAMASPEKRKRMDANAALAEMLKRFRSH